MIIKELAFNLQQIGIVALILVGLCAVTGVAFFGNRQEYREPTGICPSLVVPTHTPLPPPHLAKVAPSSPWTTVTATGTTPKAFPPFVSRALPPPQPPILLIPAAHHPHHRQMVPPTKPMTFKAQCRAAIPTHLPSSTTTPPPRLLWCCELACGPL